MQLQGGLGNQLFQYSAGLASSILENKRLLLDTSALSSGTRGFEIDWLAGPDQNLTFAWNCWIPRPSSRVPILRRALGIKRIIEPHYHYSPVLQNLPDRTWASGYWQSPRYFQVVADRIDSAFKLLGDRLTPAGELTRAQIASHPLPIAVQVRRGDYVANPITKAWHGVCGEEYFAAGMNKLWRESKRRRPRFFVFSDDPDWCSSNLKRPGGDVTVLSAAEQGSPSSALYLMSLCSQHVISNSSFGWWGAWLARHVRGHRVVRPNRWFTSAARDTKDLLPSYWESVE